MRFILEFFYVGLAVVLIVFGCTETNTKPYYPYSPPMENESILKSRSEDDKNREEDSSEDDSFVECKEKIRKYFLCHREFWKTTKRCYSYKNFLNDKLSVRSEIKKFCYTDQKEMERVCEYEDDYSLYREPSHESSEIEDFYLKQKVQMTKDLHKSCKIEWKFYYKD